MLKFEDSCCSTFLAKAFKDLRHCARKSNTLNLKAYLFNP